MYCIVSHVNCLLANQLEQLNIQPLSLYASILMILKTALFMVLQ